MNLPFFSSKFIFWKMNLPVFLGKFIFWPLKAFYGLSKHETFTCGGISAKMKESTILDHKWI